MDHSIFTDVYDISTQVVFVGSLVAAVANRLRLSGNIPLTILRGLANFAAINTQPKA